MRGPTETNYVAIEFIVCISINETAFVEVAARRVPLEFQATSKISADPRLNALISRPVATDQILSCPPRDPEASIVPSGENAIV